MECIILSVTNHHSSHLHTLGGHAGWLVEDLELVPARGEGVVADEILQGRLLQPAGAEGGAAVGVLKDGMTTRQTLWREACKQKHQHQPPPSQKARF